MNLEKQYLIQCIIAASNNLRLSSEKIEVVSLIREYLETCKDLEDEITKMKRKTELSKFGIRLGEIYYSITKNKIDFLKVSETFKEHSHGLVQELSSLLDVLTPPQFRNILFDFTEININVGIPSRGATSELLNNINIPKPIELGKNKQQKSESDELKEEFILDDVETTESFNFEDFEKTILTPIKDLDQFLKCLGDEEYSVEKINNYIEIMNKNAKLSKEVGFGILCNMHKIFARSLELVRDGIFEDIAQAVEAMRACLIVIVAVVRRKEVDITNYLNKAESFGREVLHIN